MSLRFKGSELRPVLLEANVNHCQVVLAKGEGVYFRAEKAERRPDGRATRLAYAVGCNPETDPSGDWWELACLELGCDDFQFFFARHEEVFVHILRNSNDLMLSFTTPQAPGSLLTLEEVSPA